MIIILVSLLGLLGINNIIFEFRLYKSCFVELSTAILLGKKRRNSPSVTIILGYRKSEARNTRLLKGDTGT